MDGCTAVVHLTGSGLLPNYTFIMRLDFPVSSWRSSRLTRIGEYRVETLTRGCGCGEIGLGMVWIEYVIARWGNVVRRGGPQGSGRIEGKTLCFACVAPRDRASGNEIRWWK